MQALVIYDSAFGNTAVVARAIAEGLDATATAVQQATIDGLAGIEMLAVGSPTQGGRPTKIVTQFLDQIPGDSLRGVRVLAFDTRMDIDEQTFGLRLLMRTIGYAAPRIASALERKGGVLAAPPEGFIVEGKEGPLRGSEEIRARSWASGALTRAA
jgi:flavodoxin